MRTHLAACLLTLVCGLASPVRAADGPSSLDGRPVERLTLEQLDAHAMERAPRVREAAARTGLADARMEGAEIVLPANPTLEAGIANQFLGGYGLRKFEAGLSQAIEIAGQRGTRMRAAEAYGERLEAQLDEVRWEVHRDVHALYYRTLLAERRLQLAGEVAELATTLEETTAQRKEAGEVGRMDVEVAGAEAARAREEVVKARQALQQRALRLAEVVGWEEQTVPLAAGTLPEVRRTPEAEALVERAMKHEPTLQAIRAKAEQAGAELEVARREVWPNPKIGVAYEEEQRLGPNLERSLWLQVGLPLPLWRRNQEAKATARVEEKVARTGLEARRRRLETRIRREAARVNRAAERVAIFGTDILPRFDEQLELLRKGFELGEMSILDVFNARDRLLETQRKALDAMEAYFEALADLERSLGTEVWSASEEK